MASLEMVAAAIRHDDFAVLLDLSEAYFHITVAAAHRHFLHFKFQSKFFQFKAMPFRFCTTPRISTKLMLAISWYCRQHGIRIIFYLHDTIIFAQTHDLAIAHRDFVMNLLKKLGFNINLEKSDLAPAKRFTFLGLVWDSASHSLALTEENISKPQCGAQHLLEASCQEVQSFLGLSNFVAFAMP